MNQKELNTTLAYARFHGAMQAMIPHLLQLVDEESDPNLVAWIKQGEEALARLHRELKEPRQCVQADVTDHLERLMRQGDSE